MTTRTLKLLPLLLACTLATGITAFGQASSDDDTIVVKATVLNPITVTGVNDLDFGYILADGSANTVAADAADAGSFTVDATADEGVELSFTAPTTLARAGGGEVGDVTFSAGQYRYHLGGTTQGSGTTVANLTTATITPTVDQFGVWIGGTLTADADAVPGDYSANFTLTVEYVN